MVSAGSNRVSTGSNNISAANNMTVTTKKPADAGRNVAVATINQPTDAGSNMVATNQPASDKDVATKQPIDEGSNMTIATKQQTNAASSGQEMILDAEELSKLSTHTHKETVQDVHNTKNIADIYNASSKNTKQNVLSSVIKHSKRTNNSMQENFHILLFRFLINSYNWNY